MKIAIIGGGIGGLTLAVALARRGLDATVYEAAPKLEAVGAGIWLPANAMTAMAQLGLAPELRGRGVPLTSVELADQDTLLSAVDLRRIEARIGQTTVSILRSELQAVLVTAVGLERIALGKRVAKVSGRVVHFEDGTGVEADVIVGADGLRSTVRAHVSPAELRYSGQTCYRGIAQLELPDEVRPICRETWGGLSRFGCSAVSTQQAYWFAVTECAAGGRDVGSMKAALLERYAKFPQVVRAALEATPDAAIHRLDMYDHEPLPRWWRDGCVLLGDAAHAMTPNLGQGGGQAIEDALCLARCLSEHAPVDAAFAAYEAERGPRARKVAKIAWSVGQTAHWTNPLACAVRNTALRLTPARLAQRQTDAIYGVAVKGG